MNQNKSYIRSCLLSRNPIPHLEICKTLYRSLLRDVTFLCSGIIYTLYTFKRKTV